MTMLLKGCPRCGGDLMPDAYREMTCLQCGAVRWPFKAPLPLRKEEDPYHGLYVVPPTETLRERRIREAESEAAHSNILVFRPR